MSDNNQLLIPETLKVGFQNRTDTYSGKLGYVVYFDQTGKLRKEASWEGWRDKKIDPVEPKNEPTEGFVLNKKVGGVSRYSHSWDQRIEKCRVYDPRGWEFEITIPNLLFILQECTSIKGKGLDGQFVYGWAGKELVLLPITCSEYKESQKFTKLQAQKISAKTLIIGATYHTKQQTDLLYLGRHEWFDGDYERLDKQTQSVLDRYNYYRNNREYYETSFRKSKGKKYVFASVTKNGGVHIQERGDVNNLAAIVSETPPDNYAEIFEVFGKSENASLYDKLVPVPVDSLEFDALPTINEQPLDFYYRTEDAWSNAFNKLHLYVPQQDGSFMHYDARPLGVANPNYDPKINTGANRLVFGDAYVIKPYKKIWFDNGKKCSEYVSAGREIKKEERRYNGSTGRYETVYNNDNRQYEGEIIYRQENFKTAGFCKLFLELKSGSRIQVKD